MGRSSLWSISWLCHQMFYACVTISATQARESDDLRHAMSPFSLSFLFFKRTKNLGICEATKDRSDASSKNREKKEHLEEPALWRNWPSNAPLKDSEAELKRSMCDWLLPCWTVATPDPIFMCCCVKIRYDWSVDASAESWLSHFKTTSKLPQINLNKNLDWQKNDLCWQSERGFRKQTETLFLSKPSNPIQLFKALSTVRGFHTCAEERAATTHQLRLLLLVTTHPRRYDGCLNVHCFEQKMLYFWVSGALETDKRL